MMTEPATGAGKRLLAALSAPESTVVPSSVLPLIVAIEAEAIGIATAMRWHEHRNEHDRIVNAALDKVDAAVLSIPAANQNPSWVKAQARAAIEAARPKP